MQERADKSGKVTVVIATRNRRDDLLHTLMKLRELASDCPVIVVDNGSRDGGPAAVRARFPEVTLIELADNRGAAARNLGAREASTPYVAFADDDSWWAPGALARAARHLDAHPRLALVAARIVVGREGRVDPTCEAMSQSPLPIDGPLPGPAVLGFVACGAVVRRRAFLDAGGFSERLLIIGEEELVALDLAAAGWSLAYADDVVAHHHPSPSRDRRRWLRLRVRNGLWTTWLRRRGAGVLSGTARVVAQAALEGGAIDGVLDALRGLPWVLRERRPLPPDIERDRRLLEAPRSFKVFATWKRRAHG